MTGPPIVALRVRLAPNQPCRESAPSPKAAPFYATDSYTRPPRRGTRYSSSRASRGS